MSFKKRPTYGGAREHGRHPRGYRALGIVEADTDAPDSADPNENGATGDPGGGGEDSFPVTRTGGEGDPPPLAQPGAEAPAAKEAGFGILGLVVALIFGAALSRMMSE